MDEKQPLSLNDIMTENTTPPSKNDEKEVKKPTTQTVTLEDIIGKREPKPTVIQRNQQALLDKIDVNLKRVAEDRLTNVFKPFKEACMRAAAEAELNGEEPSKSFEEAEEKLKRKEKKEKMIESFDKSTDDDLDELLENIDKAPNDSLVDSKEKDLEDLLSDGEDEVFNMDIVTPLAETKPLVEDKKVEIVEDNHETPKEKLEVVKEPVVKEEEENKTSIEKEISNPTTVPTINDEDLNSLIRDTQEETELTEEEKAKQKEIRENFQKQVFEALGSPVKIDRGRIKTFKVASKPISINSVLKTNTNVATATWALPNSGRLITLSSLSGEEIENLNRDTDDDEENTNLLNRLIFNTIYNHLIDASKPATMEEWVKTINWFDINDLYFALYLATFKNSNFVTYSCTNDKCQNVFLEEKKYKDMISYTDDKAKELYATLLKSGIDATPTTIKEDIIPINDKYAIGFRAPSIYDMVFGVSSLDEGFRNKYASIIGNISYMANVYYISPDDDGGTLYPISFNARNNDTSRTMKNKIVAYYNILKNFSSDEYSIVTRTIADIDSQYGFKSTYHYPDTVCPKCHTAIKRADQSVPPLAMVFIRHRLVQLASSMSE